MVRSLKGDRFSDAGHRLSSTPRARPVSLGLPGEPMPGGGPFNLCGQMCGFFVATGNERSPVVCTVACPRR